MEGQYVPVLWAQRNGAVMVVIF